MVGSRTEPPFAVEVDLGDRNIDRTFTVIAYGAWGGVGVSTATVPSLEINENVEIALRQLYVTVELNGERVLDLGREKFTVFDRGEPRRLVTFERGDVPISAVLLLDASSLRSDASLDSSFSVSRCSSQSACSFSADLCSATISSARAFQVSLSVSRPFASSNSSDNSACSA